MQVCAGLSMSVIMCVNVCRSVCVSLCVTLTSFSERLCVCVCVCVCVCDYNEFKYMSVCMSTCVYV